MAAIMASARSPRGGPIVQLDDQLLAIDVVDLDANLAEAELRRHGQGGEVVGRDGSAKSVHAMFRRGPVEERPDHLGRDALAALGGLDAVADLDPPRVVGRAMEPAGSRGRGRPGRPRPYD